MAAADGAAHRRLPRAGGPAPGAAPALLPVPRPRRLRSLPGRPRVSQARRENPAGLLRALEPAALPSRRAVHRPGAVAQRLPVLSGQRGALPAQSRRLMVVRREVTAAVALLALSLVLPPVLTGCREGSSSSPSGGPSGPVATAPHTTPSSGTPTSTPSPTDDAVGSPERPVAAAVGTTLLDWKSVPGSTENVVTVGDGWTLTVPNGGDSARLQGPKPFTIRAAEHSSITDAFLDDTHALVVDEDRLAADPDRAVLVDLASGRKTTLNGRSDPPTVVGGTWALGPDSLVHA